MAYPDAFGNDPEAAATAGSVAPRLMGWLGALSSAALMAGLVVWVHDLATRDVRNVPVVRAMDGPARVAPDDPGGFEAAHQGLALNRVPAEAPAPPVGERIVLAPEPVGPAPEDISPQDDEPAATAAAPADPADVLRNAIDGALSEVLGEQPIAGDGAAPAPAASPAVELPRPTPRPDPDIVTRAAPDAGLPVLASFQVKDAASIPPGTGLAQLGRFGSRDAAFASWAELDARFGAYLATRTPVVEELPGDGGTYYRLQAQGFDDVASARAFCAVLEANGDACVATVKR
ncbi:SPOR domain-containing protein [Meridianimarinicoccus sp. RP-17]|uniref:SPOR domain-containing protein n=1 Tax=Meridianimarinicoccus zhengii TaxID=2056810 RepID=UPI000DAEA020|nr:SPOR domain-containing protein [Phycocomes zhengii]